MKLILDSNVIIAAFATHGICHSIFEFCLTNHEIYISEDILGEVGKNLESKIKLNIETIDDINSYLIEHCTVSIPEILKAPNCRDDSDLHILGLAENISAELIITGDQDLLIMKEFEETKILSPRGSWEMIKK